MNLSLNILLIILIFMGLGNNFIKVFFTQAIIINNVKTAGNLQLFLNIFTFLLCIPMKKNAFITP